MADTLAGLTAQDREEWEKKYARVLNGKPLTEVDRLYKNSKFNEKFHKDPLFSYMKTMEPAQKDSVYNESVRRLAILDAGGVPNTDMGGRGILKPTEDEEVARKAKIEESFTPDWEGTKQSHINTEALEALGKPEDWEGINVPFRLLKDVELEELEQRILKENLIKKQQESIDAGLKKDEIEQFGEYVKNKKTEEPFNTEAEYSQISDYKRLEEGKRANAKDLLDAHVKVYKNENPSYANAAYVDKIKEKAKNLPAFRKYKNYDWAHITQDEWAELGVRYNATLEAYEGDEVKALERLSMDILENAYQKEPTSRLIGMGLKAAGYDILGAAATVIGYPLAAIDHMVTSKKDFDPEFNSSLRWNQTLDNSGIIQKGRGLFDEAEHMSQYEPSEKVFKRGYEDYKNNSPENAEDNEVSDHLQHAISRKDVENMMLDRVVDKYKEDNPNYFNSAYVDEVKAIGQNMAVYKKYAEFDWAHIDLQEWAEMGARYQATLMATNGDVLAALLRLSTDIMDNAAEKESLWRKTGLGLKSFYVNATGTVLNIMGLVEAAVIHPFTDTDDFDSELDGYDRFTETLLNTISAKNARELMKYGTEDVARIKKIDEELGGISDVQFAVDSNASPYLNVNTGFEVFGESAFTVATMLASMGASAMTAKVTGAVGKKLTTAAASQNLKYLTKVNKALLKNEKYINRAALVGVAGFMGTPEAVMEAGQTRDGILNAELAKNDAYFEKKLREVLYAKVMDYTLSMLQLVLGPFSVEGNIQLPPTPGTEGQVNISPEILEQLKQETYAELLPMYELGKRHIEVRAIKAAGGNLMANSFYNGLANATLKATLLAKGVQQALKRTPGVGKLVGNSKPRFTYVNGVATPIKQTAKQSIWNASKSTMGEMGEEWAQVISDLAYQGAEDANVTAFLDNIYNGDASMKVGSAFEDYNKVFTHAAVDAATSEEAGVAMVHALLMLGAMPMYRGTQKADYTATYKDASGATKLKFSMKRREDESIFGHARRISPFKVDFIETIYLGKEYNAALVEEAQMLTDYFAAPENVERLKNATGSVSWAMEMEKSADEADEFSYRNGLFGKTITDIIMLDKLKGTPMHDAHMADIKFVADLVEGSEDAKAYVERVKGNPLTADKTVSDTEIVRLGKKNAKQMLELLKSVEKEKANFTNALGEIDDDTMGTLIFAKEQIKNWKSRAQTLEQEINAVDIAKTVSENKVSKDYKKFSYMHGSIANLERKKAALATQMSDLNTQIAAIKDKKKPTKLEKGTLFVYNKIKKEALQIEKNLKQASKLAKLDELFDEHNILALAPEERARMLDPKNINNYTAEQQAVIKNVIQNGTVSDTLFTTKVKDAGRIAESEQRFLNQYNKLLSDPGAIRTYASQVRTALRTKISKDFAAKLNTSTSYEYFESEMEKVRSTFPESEEAVINQEMENAAKNDPQHFFHKYKKDTKDFMDLINLAATLEEFAGVSLNDKELFALTVKFLQSKNIDLNDKNAVTQAVTKVDAEGRSEFQMFINNARPITSKDKPEFTSYGDILGMYHFIKNAHTARLQSQEVVNPVIKPTTTTEKDSKPTEAVVPTIKETKPEKEEITPENPEEVTPIEANENNPLAEALEELAKIETAITTAKNAVTNANKAYSDKARTAAMKVVEGLKIEKLLTVEDVYNALYKAATEIGIKSEGDKDINHQTDLILKAAASIIQRAQTNSTEAEVLGNTYNTYESVLTGITPNPDASQIEILNLAYFKKFFKAAESAVQEYFETHQIEKFLASMFQEIKSGKKGIRFIYDPVLQLKVKDLMGPKYNDNSMPIIAVIASPQGTISIEENGKIVKYQPIGILPGSNNKRANGAKRTQGFRNLVPRKVFGNNPILITDENNKPVEATFSSKVHAKNPQQAKNRKNNSLISVVLDQLNSSKSSELVLGKNKKDRRSDATYKKERTTFLKRFKIIEKLFPGESQKRKMIVFETSKLNGQEGSLEMYVFIKEGGNVVTTTDRNSEKTIVQLFEEGSVEAAMESNSRVKRFGNKLNQFLTKNFAAATLNVVENKETDTATIAKESAAELKELENKLTQGLHEFIRPQGYWEYKLTPTMEKTPKGNRVYKLSLENTAEEDNSIDLGNVSKEGLDLQGKFLILLKLMAETSTTEEGKAPLALKLLVTYNDINIMNSTESSPSQKEMATKNMEDLFDDDIFQINVDNTDYQVTGFTFYSPFNLEGNLTPQTQVVTLNREKESVVVTPTGTAVDATLGVTSTTTKTTTPKKSNKREGSKKAVDKLVKNAKIFELSEDGRHYTNTKTGELFLNLDYVEPTATNQDVIPTSIKEGVSELFESNPELANAVYEALGFKIKNEKWDILSNSIGKVIEIETNDGDYYKAKITSIKKRNNDSIFLKAKTAKGKEYSYLIDLQGQPIGNKQHFEWINTGDIWKADYEYDLTSQQKQQAQQMYSQYLDTVFPDSKVKDIVYHGTLDIEGFKEFTDREKTLGQVIQQKSSSKDLIEQQVKLQGLYDLLADIVIPGTIKEGETSLNTVSTIDYVAYDVDGNIAILSNESENKSADLAKMWLQKQHLLELTGVRVFRLYTVAKDGTITQVKKANIEKMAELSLKKVKTLLKESSNLEAREDVTVDVEKTEAVKPVTQASDKAMTSILGLDIEDFDMFEHSTEAKESIAPTDKTEVVDRKLAWGVWEGYTDAKGNQIDVKAKLAYLKQQGITEETWAGYFDDMKKNILDC